MAAQSVLTLISIAPPGLHGTLPCSCAKAKELRRLYTASFSWHSHRLLVSALQEGHLCDIAITSSRSRHDPYHSARRAGSTCLGSRSLRRAPSAPGGDVCPAM